jgi:hypothetical protein
MKEIKIRYGAGILVSWFVAWLAAWFLSAWFERRKLMKSDVLYAGDHGNSGAFGMIR